MQNINNVVPVAMKRVDYESKNFQEKSADIPKAFSTCSEHHLLQGIIIRQLNKNL
jgi:hypothetical protein